MEGDDSAYGEDDEEQDNNDDDDNRSNTTDKDGDISPTRPFPTQRPTSQAR